jgi:hypothetical protein
MPALLRLPRLLRLLRLPLRRHPRPWVQLLSLMKYVSELEPAFVYL